MRSVSAFYIFSAMIFLILKVKYVSRSNFLGTKFTIFDNQPPYDCAIASNRRSSRRIHSKQVSPRVPAGNYNIANISYELNVLRSRGPRRMQCTMHSVPVSSIQEGGTAPTLTGFPYSLEEQLSTLSISKNKEPIVDFSSTSLCEPPLSVQSIGEPLVLKNKSPRWHEQLQCWCLNFRGRVTVASVKNFQLVAAVDPSHQVSLTEQEKVILQFGKIGKDIFTMDYRYPLSAFQAFAICLSSFDTKPACEWQNDCVLWDHSSPALHRLLFISWRCKCILHWKVFIFSASVISEYAASCWHWFSYSLHRHARCCVVRY